LYKLRKKELKETSQKLKEILKNASDMQSSPALGNSEIAVPHTLVKALQLQQLFDKWL